MKREEKCDELRRVIAAAQEIKITNGAIVAVMEGKLTAFEALRESSTSPGSQVRPVLSR